MIRTFVWLFILSSFSMAQFVGPYLQHQQQKVLAKRIQIERYHLFLKGEQGLAEELRSIGINPQTRAGDMITVAVNRAQLADLATLSHLERINMTPKQTPQNSISVNYQNVDVAYTHGSTGSDVIVGIIDTGIDFYHPMFRKENGDTRILSIWDQSRSGTPPSGFDYGTEYTQSQINNDLDLSGRHSIVPHRDQDGHGTHVAGSAVGYDHTISPPDTLNGGAIEANIIVVESNLEGASIVDAVDYIFKKAEAAGKAAVANISLGNQFGPHDGTNDEALTIDELSGPGKIVVRSAGNSGGDKIHYYDKTVQSRDSIEFGYSDYLTCWLEKGDRLTSVSLYWESGSITDLELDENSIVKDQRTGVELYLAPGGYSQNRKISTYVFLSDSSMANQDFILTLNELDDNNNNGQIERHAWAGSSVLRKPYDGFSQGDSYESEHYPYTVSNNACGLETIAVGSFITRNVWPSVDGNNYTFPNSGENGGIARYSSIGPTADLRHKPDVIAGGTIVLSARSKDAGFSTPFLPPSPYTEDYAYLQGTSMAAPTAAGAIALLLDKYPNWGPEQIMDYLHNHAKGTEREANLTEQNVKVKEDPNTWDRVFGYGAIDLTHAFTTDVVDTNTGNPESWRLAQNYPNPFNKGTTIKFQLQQPADVTITIYNLLGQKIYSWNRPNQTEGVDEVIWLGQNFGSTPVSSGVYIYELRTSNGITERKKMVLLK